MVELKIRKMKVQKNVEIHYSDEARLELAKSLNKRRQEIERLEQEKKDGNKDFRERIKSAQSELVRELRIVEQGKEHVVGAQCEMELNEETKRVTYTYADKVIEERDATEEDAKLFNSKLFPEHEPAEPMEDPLADIDDESILGGSTTADIREVAKDERARGKKAR